MPELQVKTFTPSEKEFTKMGTLLKSIEMDAQCQQTGIAKVSRDLKELHRFIGFVNFYIASTFRSLVE